MASSYRLAILKDGEWLPHRYEDVFGLDEPYLAAAPAGHPLVLAISLLDVMKPPYRIELEVLESEGLPYEDGTVIAIASGLSRDETAAWLQTNSDLLESDARLAVLVHGADRERIVYDEHNRLLLSGPIVDFEAVLLSQGLLPGDVSVPMPHVHRYRDDLTWRLASLLA